MSRLSLVLGVVILMLAITVTMGTSAGRRQNLATPTPAGRQDAGAELVDSVPSSHVSIPDNIPDLAANSQSSDEELDPEELEAFRRDLLDLTSSLQELYPYAEAYAQVSGGEPPPLINRSLIQSMTYEQLDIVRDAFGEAYGPFKEDINTLELLLETKDVETKDEPVAKDGEMEARPEALGPDAVSASQPRSIGLIPAPTPVTSPPPGIEHEEIDEADKVNERLGDLPTPGYPTSVGCPETRFPNAATLTTLIATFIAKEVDDFAESAGCEGTFFVVAAPFGGGTNLPGCLGWAVLKGITLAAEAVDEGLNFCIGAIDAAELEAARKNARILHAELAVHDDNLTDRFNESDKFLFHFRNLNLRSRIEANLSSEEDDPVALFTLPNSICIEDVQDLTDSEENDPAVKYSSGRVASCGLLEVVSDTVRSAIDMTQNANLDVNNAEKEFDAALDHYENERWKLAYDRFRKAYREAIRP